MTFRNRLVGYRLQLPGWRGRQSVRGSWLGCSWRSRTRIQQRVDRNRIYRKLQQQKTKHCRIKCRQTAHQLRCFAGLQTA